MSTITIVLPDEDLDFLRAYSKEHGTSAEAFLAQQAHNLREHLQEPLQPGVTAASGIIAPEIDGEAAHREHLKAVRALPSDSQRAVLSYVSFLQYQEEERRAEAGEVEWDRLFSQPEKMAKFADWARESLVQYPPEPFDNSRL